MKNCFGSSVFDEQGVKISFNNAATTKASILSEKTVVNINSPITIKTKNSVQEISKFSYEIPFRLGYTYDIANELIDKIIKEPNYIDLTFLLSKDLDISLIHFDECNDIYVILDNYSKTGENNNYLFLFAAKLEDKYCKFELNETTKKNSEAFVENHAPVLNLINYSTAYLNKQFTYNVTASDPDNDKIFFLDNHDLFQIHPLLGTIRFTPRKGQEGLYKINITVVDINGGIDSQWFYLEIK